ncbi:sirohydrochlorin cobaltochelatase [Lentilactobacillus kisonensis]|uniref:sirohydrochlorin cobaltochelatase n=1 Tax=Lentilactobacillus kisonensis TaxID=481722 RepID=UPI0024368250|nr:sirohydrochlorin cobaltochelatase [Lentilactobacillus kisonensis]
MHEAGFEDVFVQSLHLIPGIEYDMVKAEVEKFQGAFKKIVLGSPLLKTFADYQRLVEFIKHMDPDKPTHSGLLLMGHGTADSAFTAYACLDHMLMGSGNYVGAVESYPDIDFEINRLVNDGIKHVILQPLMMVAGNHAHHDMESDSPTSWSSKLQAHGITADAKFIGLGEYPEIQQMYIDHLKTVM